MKEFIVIFEEFTMKAILMTESILSSDFNQDIDFNQFTSNRERLFQVLDQISQEINWDEVAEHTKNELNRKIEYIKKLDVQLLAKLQEYQTEVKKEIEQTVRQKDNIRGYNLSDVK